jgi:hypothetical protein
MQSHGVSLAPISRGCSAHHCVDQFLGKYVLLRLYLRVCVIGLTNPICDLFPAKLIHSALKALQRSVHGYVSEAHDYRKTFVHACELWVEVLTSQSTTHCMDVTCDVACCFVLSQKGLDVESKWTAEIRFSDASYHGSGPYFFGRRFTMVCRLH